MKFNDASERRYMGKAFKGNQRILDCNFLNVIAELVDESMLHACIMSWHIIKDCF